MPCYKHDYQTYRVTDTVQIGWRAQWNKRSLALTRRNRVQGQRTGETYTTEGHALPMEEDWSRNPTAIPYLFSVIADLEDAITRQPKGRITGCIPRDTVFKDHAGRTWFKLRSGYIVQ